MEGSAGAKSISLLDANNFVLQIYWGKSDAYRTAKCNQRSGPPRSSINWRRHGS